MKKEIHPEYREVLFHDTSVDKYFLIPSTLNTDQTKEWEDGKTYPYYPSAVKSEANDSSEEETVEAQEEVTETPVEEVQEDISEAPTEEAAQEETSKDKE